MKITIALLLAAATLAGAPPAFAMQTGRGPTINTSGPNCTMDPFNKVYVCRIKVCQGKDKNGKPICTTTTVESPY